MLFGCVAEDEGWPAGADPAAPATGATHTREILFAGDRGGDPLVASLVFRSAEGDSLRAREARGWVAHDGHWESFLDERWTVPAVGSPWAVVPRGPLRIAAGLQAEVEALWYERGGRALRLEMEQPLSSVNRGARGRMLLHDAALEVGGERTPGAAVEVLHTPASGGSEAGTLTLLLVGRGDLVLLQSGDGAGDGVRGDGWLRQGGVERGWTEATIVARGERPLPEARRSIPRGWRLEVASLGARVDLHATGFMAEIGRERAGRRGVEVRYTLEGSLALPGSTIPVRGAALYRVD